MGVSNNGYTSDVEIIDITNPKNYCFNVAKFPDHLEKMSAAEVDGGLIICGILTLIFYNMC